MSVNLPTPHPDEILYSVLCRLITRTGWSGRTLSTRLFGEITWCCIDLCGRLDALTTNLGPAMRLTTDDILNRLTLFPFYAAGAPAATRSAVAAMLKEGTSRHVHARLGVLAQSVKRPTQLRFCPACRDEDLNLLGETYWRRSHQLPGVVACPNHPSMLIESGILGQYMTTSAFYDATDVLPRLKATHVPFEPWQIARAHAVSVRCSSLLNEPWDLVRTPLDIEQAHELARRKGMLGAWGGIDHPRIASHVISFYGQDLLDITGFQSTPSALGELYWVKKHFVDFRHNVFPVSAALLAIALEALPDATEKRTLFVRKKGKPPRRPRPGELVKWRAEWMKAVEDAVPPKVSTARKKNAYLVNRLRAWDREWYLAFNAKHRTLRKSGVNMMARDEQVLAKLIQAEKELKAVENGSRRTRAAMLNCAQVLRGWIGKLPRSKKFLDTHNESAGSYYERKLQVAAERLLRDGKKPTRTSLALVSGLGFDAVTGPEAAGFTARMCALMPEDFNRPLLFRGNYSRVRSSRRRKAWPSDEP